MKLLKSCSSQISRQCQNPALFGCLDAVGAHPIEIDPGALRTTGPDRLEDTGAHLHRFLHHVVEASVLQGCERVDQVWRRYLRTGLFLTDKIRGFAAFDGDFGPPFAIPPVEDQRPNRQPSAAGH